MRTVVNVEVQFTFKEMTHQMHPGIYEIFKISKWKALLSHHKQPVYWNKPTDEGTIVLTRQLRDQSEKLVARQEFESYIHLVNAQYGLDIDLRREASA